MKLCILPCVLFLSMLSSNAQPIYFPTTGSWYDIVYTQSPWTTVNAAAAATSYLGRPGRLVTINSQQENDFLVNSLMPPTGEGYWLGGIQLGGPEPSGGWKWITDEPWSFTNWFGSEPNNASGSEDFIEIYTLERYGKWNDLGHDQQYYTSGYLIEYAPVPEPSTLALIGLGATAMFFCRRLP